MRILTPSRAINSLIFLLTLWILLALYPVKDYELYRQYSLESSRFENITPSSFKSLSETFSKQPRLLIYLLEKGYASESAAVQEEADELGQALLQNREHLPKEARIALLSVVDRARALDRRYEKSLVDEGLFYLPNDLYFLSRKYLLHYERSALTELTPYERTKALAFLENMLRSEERSS